MKLEPTEQMDLFSGFQQYTKLVAILHPITSEIIRDDNGNIATQSITNLPVHEMIKILAHVIKNWEGLEGESGVIPYTEKNIKYLFNRALNVKIKEPRQINGVKKEVDINQSFADYIQSELQKSIEKDSEGVIDLAPKTKTSLKRV